MELDQETLESLPRSQRLRFAKKARQEQLKKYYQREYEERLEDKEDLVISPNRKGQHVNFDIAYRLRDAVTRFDDKEVLSLLEQGADPDTASENGITLLHQCCMDDNITIAELLIQRGADVNLQDEDWWTPLHAASACEMMDIVILLLKNGADPTILDIDGMLPIDHPPAGSETRQALEQHLKNNGLDETSLRNLKRRDALRMLADVKDFLLTGGDINTSNDNGTTLLHIAAANNYRDVGKVLLDKGADIDPVDDDGMTPLHVASKFGNLNMVKLLVRRNANPNLQNYDDEKPADLSATELIDEILKSAEQMYIPNQKESSIQIIADEDDSSSVDEQNADISVDTANAKTQRRHVSIAKSEMVFEAQTRVPGDEEKRAAKEGFHGHGLKVIPDDEMEFDDDDDDADVVYLPNPSSTDDLASLSELTENMILQELMLRYSKDVIYTYVGDILIAVNPFKQLPIYSMQVSEKYNDLYHKGDLTPHVFGITDKAFQSMLREQKSQCCIISGESGAGKTETGKFVVQHLLSRAHSSESLLNVKIEQVNPLLECFGNAQTVMNDNSSRFGKYLELLFSDEGRVHGARISEYLLEKSRVIQQGERERNFHIFYMLFAGLTEDEKADYGLLKPEDHRYLKASPNVSRSVYDNAKAKFTAVKDCLSLIGFTKDDEDSLFRTLSAILLLGDLELEESGDAAKLINPEILDKVAVLLQVSGDELASAIMSETTYTRGEAITKVRNVSQASECRDALAKAIYSRLFSWVVNNINQLLQPLEECETAYEIGILDIFGFENFNHNSFEQMCINLANEQLQNFFNEYIFLQEQDECESEGISLDRINFTNNKPVVDVFLEKHLGIIALLDEESHFPGASDKSLATKLHNGPGVRAKNIYKAPRDGGLNFEIFHYAGIVQYDLNGVLEKNKDTLAKSVQFTMKTSSCPLVREMFQFRITRTGSLAPSVRQRESRKSKKSVKKPQDAFEFFKQKRKSDRQSRQQRRRKNERPIIGTERKGPATLAFHFKNSLMELMSKMRKSSPHFVRCIKPNTAKLPDKFTPEYVIAQLRYTGVMETTRIRREGYPMRLTPEEFLERYKAMEIFAGIDAKKLGNLETCKAALSHYGISEWKVGYSKLFFRYWHAERLNDICRKYENKVIICQKVVRGFTARKLIKPLFERGVTQQKYVGKFLTEIDTMGEDFHQSQQIQNEYDEQRMVENFFEDVINIAETEAESLKGQQNGRVNGPAHDTSQQQQQQELPPPPTPPVPSLPADGEYVPMLGSTKSQNQSQPEADNMMADAYYDMRRPSYESSPYNENDVYVPRQLGTPRRSDPVPYQKTCQELQLNDNSMYDNATYGSRFEMGGEVIDRGEMNRKMSDDVFDNSNYVNGGTAPPPPPPPQSDISGVPPPPPAPTMTGVPSMPPAPPQPSPPQPSPPQPITSQGSEVSGMPLPPPPPPEPVQNVPGAGDDGLPPPPPMSGGNVDDGLPEDFPPPPPMAEFSSEAKQNIAAIRNKFLQEEQKDTETTSPQPTPGVPRKNGTKGSNGEELTEIGLSPGIAAKLAHFHEKQQELSSPPPQPKHNGASPRKFTMPTVSPAQQQQPTQQQQMQQHQMQQQQTQQQQQQLQYQQQLYQQQLLQQQQQMQGDTVKRRPPAPNRDPTTRLTMMATPTSQLSGIPEMGIGANQSPTSSDFKRQQFSRNRTQSSPAMGITGSADHVPLTQLQRLSMQDVPPPPSTPPPRPPSINRSTSRDIPPAPMQAPPPLPGISPARRNSGDLYQQQGMSQRMTMAQQPPAAPSPPVPQPPQYTSRPVSMPVAPMTIPPPPSVTNSVHMAPAAPSPPPPAPPSYSGNMAGNAYSSNMHQQSVPMQQQRQGTVSQYSGGYNQPPQSNIPPPPIAPAYTTSHNMPSNSNNLMYRPSTMPIQHAQPSYNAPTQQQHDTFHPPPHPPMGSMPPPPPPNAPPPPAFSNIPPPPAAPMPPVAPVAPTPPRVPAVSAMQNGINNVQLRKTERPAFYGVKQEKVTRPQPTTYTKGKFVSFTQSHHQGHHHGHHGHHGHHHHHAKGVSLKKTAVKFFEKKTSTTEAPMDNLMAELQSGFRLRPTPKQAKVPPNDCQELGDELGELYVDTEDSVIENQNQSPRAEPPRVSPKTRVEPDFPPPPSAPPQQYQTPPVSQPVKTPPPGPAPKPKPKKNGRGEPGTPPNGSSGLPPEMEEELAALPPWKRAMREKKIREELKKQEVERRKVEEEEAKWAGIPEWKKQMILKKEKKKQEEMDKMVDRDAVEMEKKLQAMPAWKREIVQKKLALEGDGSNNNQ